MKQKGRKKLIVVNCDSQTSELKNDSRKDRWHDEAHNKMHTLGSSITKSGTKLRWMLSHEGTLAGS